MRRIRGFIKRIRRATNWFFFIYKQPVWMEYTDFLEIVEKRLKDMASSFEKNDRTESSQQDARRMRLAAKLIKMYREEYYYEKYITIHWDSEKEGDMGRGDFDEEYSVEDSIKASEKDQKALRIAMRIIAQDAGGWWE